MASTPEMFARALSLGTTLKGEGRLDEAILALRQAVRLNPRGIDAFNYLGLCLKDQGRIDEAIDCFRQALRVDRRHAEILLRLGNALSLQGRIRAAIACHRRAEAVKPDYTTAASNVLFNCHFAPGFDDAALREEQRRWRRRHAQRLEGSVKPHTNDPSPGRRLRIGYVSPDFRAHCQAFFTVPLFENHDKRLAQIYCYSDVRRPDALTMHMRSFADQWRSIVGVADDQVADMIRADQIDILVDLTMHMAGNRLLVFARKPAPVQVTWLAYPGTTGLEAIDYRLSDPQLDPPGQDSSHYSEKTVRLPETFWCYHPLMNSPGVNSLPARANGFVTFGCLNSFNKVNELCVRLWAGVLRALPSARFLLLAPAGQSRARLARAFQKHGIASERLTFVPRQLRPEYFETYHQIDLGLDTMPYNGHTTSLDSMWMGVPVITLAGTTVVGRAGVSQLTNLGLPELIARTEDEFVGIAMNLTSDLPRLGELRATLRRRMERSALMDAPRFARVMEGAYRDMWQRWCAGREPVQRATDI
jgi:protein O-GlcNAc transferase